MLPIRMVLQVSGTNFRLGAFSIQPWGDTNPRFQALVDPGTSAGQSDLMVGSRALDQAKIVGIWPKLKAPIDSGRHGAPGVNLQNHPPPSIEPNPALGTLGDSFSVRRSESGIARAAAAGDPGLGDDLALRFRPRGGLSCALLMVTTRGASRAGTALNDTVNLGEGGTWNMGECAEGRSWCGSKKRQGRTGLPSPGTRARAQACGVWLENLAPPSCVEPHPGRR